jgi:hypothetical protein
MKKILALFIRPYPSRRDVVAPQDERTITNAKSHNPCPSSSKLIFIPLMLKKLVELSRRIGARNWTALLLATAIILLLGIPFTQWGFKTDDWANILHSKLTSWQQAAALFYEGNMESINHPSGSAPDPGSFLSGLYRPLSFIYYYPQTLVFGTKAYGYFLMTVLFHACNAAFFFLILSHFFSFYTALAAAAWFGFHPSLQNWLGWISAQTYFIELLVLGFVFLSFYKWLITIYPHATLRPKTAPILRDGVETPPQDERNESLTNDPLILSSNNVASRIIGAGKKNTNYYWYWLSVGLFFSNLLLKEASIVLPCWVFVATYLYIPTHGLRRLQEAIKAAAGYGCTAMLYLLIRLSVMPFSHEVGTLGFKLAWNSFITKQIARCMQFLTYSYDMLGLTWLPKGNRLINGGILIAILTLLLVLFFKSTHKKIILFCLFSSLIFSWPGLMMHYQPRYMYMALPWFIAALIFLGKSIQSSRIKKFILCLGLLSSATGGAYVFANMKKREIALHHVDSSMRTLITHTLPAMGWNKQPLCFFGLPMHWFDMGTTQAVWFLSEDNSYPVYHVGYSIVMPHQNHPWAIPQSNVTFIDVALDGLGITITSSDPTKFAIDGDLQNNTKSFTIDETLRKNGLFLITWDYKKTCFKVVGYLDAVH